MRYRFDDFVLDLDDRQLWRGGARVELAGRYFDALALLVREHGQLVAKDRFHADVWGDVVVGDDALTQAVKEIRRRLGDDAVAPRYVQTVPRYGYRFIAPVVPADAPPHAAPAVPQAARATAPHIAPALVDGAPVAPTVTVAGVSSALPTARPAVPAVLLDTAAGALGGGLAGVAGGLLYGLAATSAGAPMGASSVLVVLVALNVAVGGAGGLGVAAGWAAGRWLAPARPTARVAGAALGGMLVGGTARLLGVDAFHLLFGRAPDGITGGVEGAVLGAALALGLWLGGGPAADAPSRPILGAALAGTAAGVWIPLAGGRLMGGSLAQLARQFDGSQLRLDALGRFFSEAHFGAASQVVLGGVEGMLFGLGVGGALVAAHRVWRAT